MKRPFRFGGGINPSPFKKHRRQSFAQSNPNRGSSSSLSALSSGPAVTRSTGEREKTLEELDAELRAKEMDLKRREAEFERMYGYRPLSEPPNTNRGREDFRGPINEVRSTGPVFQRASAQNRVSQIVSSASVSLNRPNVQIPNTDHKPSVDPGDVEFYDSEGDGEDDLDEGSAEENFSAADRATIVWVYADVNPAIEAKVKADYPGVVGVHKVKGHNLWVTMANKKEFDLMEARSNLGLGENLDCMAVYSVPRYAHMLMLRLQIHVRKIVDRLIKPLLAPYTFKSTCFISLKHTIWRFRFRYGSVGEAERVRKNLENAYIRLFGQDIRLLTSPPTTDSQAHRQSLLTPVAHTLPKHDNLAHPKPHAPTFSSTIVGPQASNLGFRSNLSGRIPSAPMDEEGDDDVGSPGEEDDAQGPPHHQKYNWVLLNADVPIVFAELIRAEYPAITRLEPCQDYFVATLANGAEFVSMSQQKWLTIAGVPCITVMPNDANLVTRLQLRLRIQAATVMKNMFGPQLGFCRTIAHTKFWVFRFRLDGSMTEASLPQSIKLFGRTIPLYKTRYNPRGNRRTG